MPSFEERFDQVMTESFQVQPGVYNDMTELRMLGDEGSIDDFFDNLDFEFSGDLDEHERYTIRTVGQAISWAMVQEEAEDEDENEDESSGLASGFGWRERISPFQTVILKLSTFVGIAMFMGGVYLTTHGDQQRGGFLSGIGMFIAVQMFWGIKSFFNWLENRDSKLLHTFGYKKLFWIAIVVAYFIDMIGIGLLLGLVFPS